METRELFVDFSSNLILLFYAIGLSALALALLGIYLNIAKYRKGQSLRVPVDILASFKLMIGDVLSHRTVRRRDRYAGFAHSLIFYGFALAFIGTSIITLENDILEPLFGITFWKGKFYLVFSLILDLGGLALLVGILMMMLRRASFKLSKLKYVRAYRGESEYRIPAKSWRREDWLFMIFLLLIAITGFLQEGVRLLIDTPQWQGWSPVGLAVAKLLEAIGFDANNADSLRSFNWWFHGLLALAFLVLLPWYKAKHILTAIGSLSVRDPKALRRLSLIPVTEVEEDSAVGISRIEDFDWKDLLHFDACTKCGRCHEACPAQDSGYPLSPRDLILDLRTYNDRVKGKSGSDENLIGDIISPETLWACRSCGACQEICPVGIEHPAMIVEMRRHLVDQGEMDPLLQSTLASFGDKGNSFGESPKKRTDWMNALEFEVKDIRQKSADYLWFVGDFAAFDPRNQQVSQTVARLLRVAGIDFGTLHEDERNAGNDVRRIGEEGLFESLAEHNIEQFKSAQPFNSIITTDPHSYNTIKNEYPELADVAQIEHYSTMLAELLEQGKLKVTNPLNKRVTFHDPCHLGRLNAGYDGPRRVLEAIGCEMVEMPRNRENSFCCGAGGGRIWIPDDPGTEKPSESRMHEASELGEIDYFITSCPKDLTMYEDARKTSGHEDEFVIKDIAELVAEAIELEKMSFKELPQLMQEMADAITVQVVSAMDARLATITAALPVANNDASATPAERLAEPSSSAAKELDLSSLGAPGKAAENEELHAENGAPVFEYQSTKILTADWCISPVPAAELPNYTIPEKGKPRIVVAVKHIGKILDEFSLNEKSRDIDSSFLDFEFNEFDDNALEAALRVSESLGGENGPGAEIIVVSIGPEDAEVTLRKALAKGADRGVRIWDDTLIGADPVSVARAIAGVCVREEADLVFTGVQSSDKANGATGGLVAKILGRTCAAVVVGVDWDGGEHLALTRELEGGVLERFTAPASCVMTVQTGAFEPRFATMRMIKKAKKKTIDVLDGTSVVDSNSGFVINRIFKPPVTKAQMLEGDMNEVAQKVRELIESKG
ncbi:MAG: electron transfer flavoprotein subunit alpha [Gammaproteobacteria bacterium]|nr:MAG: electron transfer flavoprotein subunit alpha [Gammaproteobacteria bacterium]